MLCWPPSRTLFGVPAVQGSTSTQSSESTCEVWEHATGLCMENCAGRKQPQRCVKRANALTSAKT